MQRVQHLLSPLPLLALQPGDAVVPALFLGPLPHINVHQTHAQDLAVGHVDGLVRVLRVGRVPVLEGALGVGGAEVGRVRVDAGKKDLEHDFAHALALEGGEVGLVHATDVGDEGGEDGDDHFGGGGFLDRKKWDG